MNGSPEIIKEIKIPGNGFEVRSGKTYTNIELTTGGKPSGRDILLRTQTELMDLLEALEEVKEFWDKENNSNGLS